jgi:hypothetical protein
MYLCTSLRLKAPGCWWGYAACLYPFNVFLHPFHLADGVGETPLVCTSRRWHLSRSAWYVGAPVGTGYLIVGLAMTLLTFVGRWTVLVFRPRGSDEPHML